METKNEDMKAEARLERMDAMANDIEAVIPEGVDATEVVVVLVNIIGRALSFMKDREEALKIADKIPRAIRGVLRILDVGVSEDEVEGVSDDEKEGVSDAEEELRAGTAAGGEA
jgi:hypothetical protein